MTTTTDADKLAYCRCMDQVSRRLRLVVALTSGQFSSGDESADGEFACLQIRKALEELAFASLAASRESYSKVHPGLEQEWRAKRILARLEKLHPEFYPVPVTILNRGPNRWHCEPLSTGFLTREDFVFLYDRCSNAIHDWNPFREGPRVIELERPIAEWASRIERLLSHHYIRLIGRPDILLIQLTGPSGKAHVLTAAPTAG